MIALNPVLVKELRQLLRSPSFVITYLAFQSGLLLTALLSLLEGKQRLRTTVAFWCLLLFWLYVVTPFRALFVLRSELYGNTLEPMLMTTLKPHGIVRGKWLALILQNFIVISSILPYIFVRYFMGDEELTWDIVIILGFLLGSMPVVSWMIIISSSRHSSMGILLASFCLVFFFVTLGLLGSASNSDPSVFMATLVSSLCTTLFSLGCTPTREGSIFRPEPRIRNLPD